VNRGEITLSFCNKTLALPLIYGLGGHFHFAKQKDTFYSVPKKIPTSGMFSGISFRASLIFSLG
jgi:hypothetical protein